MNWMKTTRNWIAMALIATGGSAQAETYDVIELGITYDRASCMNWAESVLYRYKNSYGGGNIARGSWVVYGWDMRPGDQDVVIMCPIVSGTVDAFLVVNGETSQNDVSFTVGNIQSFWNQ